MPNTQIKMAVMLSGSGRTLQNFIELSSTGKLKAKPIGVLSSRPGTLGLKRAESAGIPIKTVNRKEYENADDFSTAVTSSLRQWKPDLVTMAGFLSFYKIPEEFENKIMNIHPALLPAFGGKGFYGDKVHEAVLNYGCKITGCTVHFANNKYDHGPIILQEAVPIQETDDADSLAGRVFAAEKRLYPRAVNLYAENRLRVTGRRVRILKG